MADNVNPYAMANNILFEFDLELELVLQCPLTGDVPPFMAAVDEAYCKALRSIWTAADGPPDILFDDIEHDRSLYVEPEADRPIKTLAKFFLDITKLKIAAYRTQMAKDKVREMGALVTEIRKFIVENPPSEAPYVPERCTPLGADVLAIIKIEDSQNSTDLDGKLLRLFRRVTCALGRYKTTSNSDDVTASTEKILTAWSERFVADMDDKFSERDMLKLDYTVGKF